MEILLIITFVLILLIANYAARTSARVKRIEKHLETLVNLWTKKG